MPVREEVPVVVDNAATDDNDAAAGGSGGPKSGSGNGGDATDGEIFLGGLSFDSLGHSVYYFSLCHYSLPSSCDGE